MAADYSEEDIKSLDWREHIRMRPCMCIGKLGEFTVHVGISLAEIDSFQRDLGFGLLMTMPLIGVMVFAGGLWLGKRAVQPVAAIRFSTCRPPASRLRLSRERPPTFPVSCLSRVRLEQFFQPDPAQSVQTRSPWSLARA